MDNYSFLMIIFCNTIFCLFKRKWNKYLKEILFNKQLSRFGMRIFIEIIIKKISWLQRNYAMIRY